MNQEDERWLLVSLMSVPIIVLLNAGMIGIALPTIRIEFDVSVARIAWVVAAYSVPLVVLMPLGNTLGDLLGKRLALLLGLLLFALASGLCAFSTGFNSLLVGRVLQGVGISGLNPICMSLIAELFPPHRRGRAVGFWQSAGPVAFAIAPILSGLVIESSGWRAIFYVLSVASVAGVCLLMRFAPQFAPKQAFPEVDWGGVLALSIGLGALMLAVAGLNSQTSKLEQMLLLLFVGVAGLIAFVWIESRRPRPFLDLGLFRNRAFAFPATAAGLRSGSIASTTFLLSLFLQEVGGYMPKQVGLLFVSRSVVSFVAIPLGGHVADQLSPNLLGAAGMTLMSVCLGLFSRLRPGTPSWLVVVNLAFFGLGMGVALPAIAKAVVNSVTHARIGMATGVERMSHSGGVVIGPSLVGFLLDARIASYSAGDAGSLGVSQAYRGMFGILAMVALIGGLLLAFSGRSPVSVLAHGEDSGQESKQTGGISEQQLPG